MSFNNLDETSPAIKQPRGLKIKLRPHQLTSVYAMLELEKQGTIIIDKPEITSGLYSAIKWNLRDATEFTNSTFIIETNSAILADKVGSGKTYMIIGLILNTIMPIVHDRFIIGTDHYSIKMSSVKESQNTNLIVVPHNLANQWETFVQNSNLSYIKLSSVADFNIFFDIDYVTEKNDPMDDNLVLYHVSRKKKIPKGTKIKRKTGSKRAKNVNTKVIYERKTLNVKKVNKLLNETNVIILNVNRYKSFKQIFRSIKWARVIVDEMDSANIPSIFDEYGNFNWFLTATPSSIFYKSCRRYVNKIFGHDQHLLQYFVVKNKEEFIDASIVLPKPQVFMIETLLQRVVSAVQDLIPKDVMNLINAGNMKEAIAKLNCDVDTEENIVKVLTDKINTELHNFNQELKYHQALLPPDEKRINGIKTEIARCKTKLETIDERIGSIKDECCFICAEEFDTPTILDCCKSVFCLKCLLSALKNNSQCPYCRHKIKNNKEYHVISAKGATKKKQSKVSSNKLFTEMDKADVLEKILHYISKNEENPRILIFSDYNQTFNNIINNIAKAGLQYALLSGIPAHITNVINDYKRGVINILMLDSQHYGSGLNLQDTNYLILYHRMTPELETQVIGRAHRFGRKKSLKIIYLINDSENKIFKLTDNPFIIDNSDELWMLNDPKLVEEIEQFEQDDEDDSKSESEKKENKKKKKKNHRNNKISEEEPVELDNSSDSSDLSLLEKPKHRRKKKIVDV